MKKFNLTVKDIMKINELFETSNEMVNPFVIHKDGLKDVYIMNQETFDGLVKRDKKYISKRNKEIEAQSIGKKNSKY